MINISTLIVASLESRVFNNLCAGNISQLLATNTRNLLPLLRCSCLPDKDVSVAWWNADYSHRASSLHSQRFLWWLSPLSNEPFCLHTTVTIYLLYKIGTKIPQMNKCRCVLQEAQMVLADLCEAESHSYHVPSDLQQWIVILCSSWVPSWRDKTRKVISVKELWSIKTVAFCLQQLIMQRLYIVISGLFVACWYILIQDIIWKHVWHIKPK